MEHILGYIAGFLTTICFVPQAIKSIITKDTKSISLLMYSLFIAGICCWLAYGVMLQSPPIMIANSLTLILAIIILVTKIKHG